MSESVCVGECVCVCKVRTDIRAQEGPTMRYSTGDSESTSWSAACWLYTPIRSLWFLLTSPLSYRRIVNIELTSVCNIRRR